MNAVLEETRACVRRNRSLIVGVPVDRAAETIRSAGLMVRVHRRGVVYSLDGNAKRVNLRVDDADRVTGATAG